MKLHLMTFLYFFFFFKSRWKSMMCLVLFIFVYYDLLLLKRKHSFRFKFVCVSCKNGQVHRQETMSCLKQANNRALIIKVLMQIDGRLRNGSWKRKFNLNFLCFTFIGSIDRVGVFFCFLGHVRRTRIASHTISAIYEFAQSPFLDIACETRNELKHFKSTFTLKEIGVNCSSRATHFCRILF